MSYYVWSTFQGKISMGCTLIGRERERERERISLSFLSLLVLSSTSLLSGVPSSSHGLGLLPSREGERKEEKKGGRKENFPPPKEDFPPTSSSFPNSVSDLPRKVSPEEGRKTEGSQELPFSAESTSRKKTNHKLYYVLFLRKGKRDKTEPEK